MSSTPPSRGGMDFNFNFAPAGAPQQPPRPAPDAPFRIALLADLSGRASRGICDVDLPTRRPRAVDIDNLDDAIASFNVAVRINAPGAVDIPITKLDDFHPDHLFRTLDLFAPLRDLRRRLLDPTTFAAAADQARATLDLNLTPPASALAAAKSSAAPTPPATQASAGVGLLESLLTRPGEKPVASKPAQTAPATPAATGTDVASIVRRMAQTMQTDAAPAADPQRDTLVAAVDAAISSRMRTVLHNPSFQRLESAWRAVHFLITSIQTDETLTIELFDISKPELMADLMRSAAAGNIPGSGLAKLLMDRSINAPGGEPWSLLIADLTLDFTTTDAALAGHLAALGARLGAPFIAAASPSHVGCASFAIAPDPDTWSLRAPANDEAAPAAWAAVRQSPEAQHLALALPRFLIRHPYMNGGGEEVESFTFTEVACASDHESYLWANPAHAAAVIIAQAFTDDGADMTLPDAGELTGLPVHLTADAAGEKSALPCAEAWLTLKASHAIQSAGFSPLLSIKNRDATRLASIQSIADPLTPLAGRWSS